jgi:transposase
VDRESLELLLGQGLRLYEIGNRFGKHPSTVSYWMEKYGLRAVNREKHLARGGIERVRLDALVGAGMTIAEIAHEVGMSKGAVRHWLRRYGLHTCTAQVKRLRALAHQAKDAGHLTVVMPCTRHGDTDFILEGRGYYRCKRCRVEAVVRRRRKVKAILVKEAGGRCCICGYDRCIGALEFHHLDPKDKRMEVSRYGVTLALDAVRAEARKCVLLCSNCHAEVENGVTSVPR